MTETVGKIVLDDDLELERQRKARYCFGTLKLG